MVKRILVISGLFALVISLSSCGGYTQGEAVIAFHNFLKNTGYVEGTYAGKHNGKIAVRASYGKAAGKVFDFPAAQVLPDEKGAGIVMQRKELAGMISQQLIASKQGVRVALAPDFVPAATIKSVSNLAKQLDINGWVLIMKSYGNCQAFDHKVKHSNLGHPVALVNDELTHAQVPLFRKLAKQFSIAGVVPGDNAYLAMESTAQCDCNIFNAIGNRFDKNHPDAWFRKLMKTQEAYRKYLIALTSIFPSLKRDSKISDVIAPNGNKYAAKRFSSGLLAHNLAKEMDFWYKAGHRTKAEFAKEENSLVSMVPSANKAALVKGIDSYLKGPIHALMANQA